jgi:hypothetical protein
MRFQQNEVIGVSVQFIGSRSAGEFQKFLSHHLISSMKGGGAISRCLRGRQGHGGMRSESLAWVKAGQRPTDTSIESVRD